jgi:hypothetical protein
MQKLFRIISLGICLQFPTQAWLPVAHAQGSIAHFTPIHDEIVSSTACPEKRVKHKGQIEHEYVLTQSAVEELQHTLSTGGEASIQFSTEAKVATTGKAKAEYEADIWVTVYRASGKKRKLEKIREKDKGGEVASTTPYDIALTNADATRLKAGDTLVIEGRAQTKAKVHKCGKGDHASASFQVSGRPFLHMTQPVLTDGGTITNADGVTLGAVTGALPAPMSVAMTQTAPSALPLPSGVRPVSDYFNISATEDTYVSFETPFILGIPVPAGEPTDGLAVAVLQPTEDFLDAARQQDEQWIIFPGVYRPEEDLFLVALPFLTADGRDIVLVEHPAFVDTAQQSVTSKSASTTDFLSRVWAFQMKAIVALSKRVLLSWVSKVPTAILPDSAIRLPLV